MQPSTRVTLGILVNLFNGKGRHRRLPTPLCRIGQCRAQTHSYTAEGAACSDGGDLPSDRLLRFFLRLGLPSPGGSSLKTLVPIGLGSVDLVEEVNESMDLGGQKLAARIDRMNREVT